MSWGRFGVCVAKMKTFRCQNEVVQENKVFSRLHFGSRKDESLVRDLSGTGSMGSAFDLQGEAFGDPGDLA